MMGSSKLGRNRKHVFMKWASPKFKVYYYPSVDMHHYLSQLLQPDLPNTEQQFGYAQ